MPSARGASADSVRVVVTGARRFDRNRLEALLRRPGGMARVAALYGDAGYWWTVVSDSAAHTADGSPVRIVRIAEGGTADLAVEAIRAEPASGVTADTSLRRFESPAEVADWIDRWLEREARNGHPFAAVETDAAREGPGGRVVVEATFEPGPVVRVADVRSVGNDVTRSRVIARELRQPMGAPYSERAVERWRRRLIRTGWFEAVGDPALAWLDSASGRAALVLEVAEGRPNRFEGVVGYQPAAGGDKGQVTGLVDLALGNLRGTGRRLAARWERPQPANTTLDLEYREPWVAGFPVDAEGLLAVEQRPGYATERIELSGASELRPDIFASAGVGREIVRSDSIVLLGGPRSRGYLLRAAVDWDTRDDPLDPVRGTRYTFAWSTSWRTNRVNDSDFVALFGEGAWPENERTSTARVDFEYYLPLGDRVVFSAAWHGAQVTSNERDSTFSAAEQLRLGGVQTVRGYREDFFVGDRMAWGNHELAYRLGAGSRAFVFVDAGAVRVRRAAAESGKRVRETAWPVGYGVGLRARTLAGVLGVDFGWARGEPFDTGKVHVRLQTAF